MKLYFFRTGDHQTIDQAKAAGALRELFIEDAADPSLSKGAAADAMEAVRAAVDMMDGGEVVQFILQDDDGEVLDACPPLPVKRYRVMASYITYLDAEIEATSLEEAERIARDMDGGDFTAQQGDDWSIQSVEEVTA